MEMSTLNLLIALMSCCSSPTNSARWLNTLGKRTDFQKPASRATNTSCPLTNVYNLSLLVFQALQTQCFHCCIDHGIDLLFTVSRHVFLVSGFPLLLFVLINIYRGISACTCIVHLSSPSYVLLNISYIITRNELASLAHSFYTSISSCINRTFQPYKVWMMLHSRLYNRLIHFTRIFHNNIIAARPVAYAHTCTSWLII